LLINASQDELDLDAVYIRALKVFCLRAGITVLNLSGRATSGIGDAVSVHRPDLIVLAGKQIDEVTITRWTNATDRSIGPRPLALYRNETTRTHNTILPRAPGDAQLRLLELADAAASTPLRQLAS
jgi:hypothetical protein